MCGNGDTTESSQDDIGLTTNEVEVDNNSKKKTKGPLKNIFAKARNIITSRS